MVPRGGKREGAGRKPGRAWDGKGKHSKLRYRQVGLTVAQEIDLEFEAERRGMAVAALIREAVAYYIKNVIEGEQR